MSDAGSAWTIQVAAGAKNCPFPNRSPSIIRWIHIW